MPTQHTFPLRPPDNRHGRLRIIVTIAQAFMLLLGKLLLLVVVPMTVILWVGGALYLYENPWLIRWIWVPFLLGWLLAFAMYRLGKRHAAPVCPPERDVAFHWTETDTAAWEKVRRFADAADAIPAERFMTLDLYVESIRDLADQLARHYHPDTRDAVHSLTVPEILTAIELATSDLRRFVEDYVPASHMLTVQWLRRAAQLPVQWRRLRPFYDALSLFWNPWGVVSRRATQHGVVNPMVKQLETDARVAIYQAFVLSAGKYLIELNSHRLKAGPDAWRKWLEARAENTGDANQDQRATPAKEIAEPVELRIVVVGQVKAGKSSLVNALIGRLEATVDVLPSTPSIARHTVALPRTSTPIVLLDTVGYARHGPKRDDVANTMAAVRQSALVMLVLHACQPARQPDLAFLRAMDAWFAHNPRFVKPPVLAVVTHIDQLPPPLEWEPPYDGWLAESPRRIKERNIRAVTQDVQTTLSPYVSGAVPACTDVANERVHGIQEWVEPALLSLLPKGRGKVLVDALYAELEQGRLMKTITQLWNASTLLVRAGFCGTDTVLPAAPRDEEKRG